MQNLYKRVIPVEETYRRLRDLMPLVGVTHVFELTALDNLGLPVCVTVGPLPKEMDRRFLEKQILGASANQAHIVEKLETVWGSMEIFPVEAGGSAVANAAPRMAAGKGLAPLDARVSAMMEAVERSSTRQVSTPVKRASYREISRRAQAVDPRQLLLISPASYDDDLILDWVEGWELNGSEPFWVPVETATFGGDSQDDGRTFVDTPTGQGAGNVIEEAICHGLAEVIEHDAWALSVARQTLSNAERDLFARMFRNDEALGEQIDEAAFRPLDPAGLDFLAELNGWLGNLEREQGWARIYDITSDVGVAAISASLSGIGGSGPDGGGLGAHPDARVALARALTESAQQRLILGLRARMRSARGNQAAVEYWHWGDPAPQKAEFQPFARVQSNALPTIQEDIDHMLSALRVRGFARVIAVDLTKPGLDVPVVKVIAPGMADYWNSAAPPDWRMVQRRMQRAQVSY
jgi:ribosomal protein S12 methylthiotransferase accessory factor